MTFSGRASRRWAQVWEVQEEKRVHKVDWMLLSSIDPHCIISVVYSILGSSYTKIADKVEVSETVSILNKGGKKIL